MGARGTRHANGGDGLSHEEIAKRLGISKTRVQQLERRALKKLRKLVAKDLRP